MNQVAFAFAIIVLLVYVFSKMGCIFIVSNDDQLVSYDEGFVELFCDNENTLGFSPKWEIPAFFSSTQSMCSFFCNYCPKMHTVIAL